MTPHGQAIFGITTGTFSGGSGVLLSSFLGAPADIDRDLGAAPPFLERAEHVPWYLSMMFLLAVAAAALFGANRSLLRREIS
jgi:hypothetical protein